MNFITGKCQVLHLGRNNPMQQYRLAAIRLEDSLAGKDLEVLVDTRLTVSQQMCSCGKGGKHRPGLHWEEPCQLFEAGSPSLLLSTARPHLEYLVRFRASQYKTHRHTGLCPAKGLSWFNPSQQLSTTQPFPPPPPPPSGVRRRKGKKKK